MDNATNDHHTVTTARRISTETKTSVKRHRLVHGFEVGEVVGADDEDREVRSPREGGPDLASQPAAAGPGYGEDAWLRGHAVLGQSTDQSRREPVLRPRRPLAPGDRVAQHRQPPGPVVRARHGEVVPPRRRQHPTTSHRTGWSGVTSTTRAPLAVPTVAGYRTSMFLFFSNRLGCLGSLVVSLGITALLVVLLSR